MKTQNSTAFILKKLSTMLRSKHYKISVAESCTGGLISKLLSDLSGSSEYFDRGFITYSNSAKTDMLGVKPDLIKKYGAVSAECALAMVQGVYKQSKSDICLSVTGIAGPRGGSDEKPVGTVFAGFFIQGETQIKRCFFQGGRKSVRMQTALYCLANIINTLE